MFLYKKEAKIQQAQLKDFPISGEEGKYQELNDVAACFFTKGEALMNNGKTEEAIAVFQKIIEEYKWAQLGSARLVLVGCGKKSGQH